MACFSKRVTTARKCLSLLEEALDEAAIVIDECAEPRPSLSREIVECTPSDRTRGWLKFGWRRQPQDLPNVMGPRDLSVVGAGDVDHLVDDCVVYRRPEFSEQSPLGG